MSDLTNHCKSCGKPLTVGRAAALCATCLTRGWTSSAAESGPAGFSIPGYEILDEMARGGMGVVYRARQVSPSREVAIKMVMPQMTLEDLRERFRIEARVMADLVHPGIMPIYQYGETTGIPWLSMTLCSRGSLAQRKEDYGGRWTDIALLMAALADAVAFAHSRGVLHRDLKPGNVLFDEEDRAYLSDFGLAKIVSDKSDLTQTISLVGTPHYLAPELIENAGQATTASDVYALGAILYELLAGRVPFDGLNLAAILKKIGEAQPDPLPGNVPRDLGTIALKCLNKQPQNRYMSAQALADDLRRWTKGEPISARRTSGKERALFWCKRNPALAAMTATLALVAVVTGTVIVSKNTELRSRLKQSLLDEARSVHMAARVQSRDSALDALRRAATMGSTLDLECEAASLLALPSVRKSAEIPGVKNNSALIPDEDLTRAVDFRNADLTRIVEMPSMRALQRLPEPVRAAAGAKTAFSTDGKWLLCASKSGSTLVMDWRSGQKVLGPISPGLQSPCISPDNRLLAGGGSREVVIYDLTEPSRPPVKIAAPDTDVPQPVDFSPDGRWLAVRGQGSTMVVYSMESHSESMRRSSRSGGVFLSGSWFDNSQGLLTGDYNGAVESWILPSPAGRALASHSAQVYDVALHPHGQLALSSGYDAHTWITDWTSGKVVGMEPGNSFFTRFNRQGTRACIQDYGVAKLKLFDVSLSKVCRQFTMNTVLGGYRPGKGSWCAEISPDGRLLATAYGGETYIYDVASSRYLGVVKAGQGNTLAWTADGRELWLPARGKISRYAVEISADEVATFKMLPEIAVPGGVPFRLAFASKSDRWALSVVDGFAFGNRKEPGKVTYIPAPVEMPASMAFNTISLSPDGRLIAVGCDRVGRCGVYDVAQSKWVKYFDCSPASFTWFAPDGKTMWLCGWQDCRVFECDSWTLVSTLADRREPGSLGFIQASEDGRLIATLDGMSVCLRRADGSPFLWLKHPLPLSAGWIALSADGRWLTFSGMGQIQQVWDLASLAVEMKALGLEWRGTALELKPLGPPIARMKAM